MGVILADNENVILANVSGKFTSLKLPVNALTDYMEVRVKRQTLGGTVVWGDNSVLRVKIAYILDGVEHHIIGQAHGGIRTHPEKGEIQEYSLGYRPTVQYKDGEVKRIGQSAKTEVAAFVEIELLEGDAVSTTVSASTTESSPPEKLIHNSVAYDADTSGQDGGAGDGVITLSHTPAGTSNLAAFLGVTSDQALSGSATYDGNAMTEIWDDVTGSWSNAGYYKVSITNSTVNVVSTLASPGAFLEHLAGVITMTGVHQTVPVGTHALATGTHADAITVTVGSVGSDDLVVDNVGHVDDSSETVLGAAGAGQTSQWTQATGGGNNNSNAAGSTQPGTAGGVMSWSHTNNGNSTWRIGAVAFKPASAATLEQEGFAFGDDDGSESTHTLNTQDTNITEVLGSNTLRVLVNATDDPGSTAYALRYQKNGAGGYVAVPVGSTNTTTPVIEAADCTVSGSNTAADPWTTVAHPACNTGDLLIWYIAWDDSTDTTDVAEPAGQNGETLIEINATPVTDSSTETRAKAWYTITTAAWTAGNLSFNPSATESWTATVVRVPAGEFDATTPIGATATSAATTTTDTTVDSPAFTAGASDGNGKLLWFAGVDADPLSATPPTGWAILQSQDLGAVTHGVAARTAAVTDSESIASATWSIAGDSWTSIAIIVRDPNSANQVYVSTSANVTASGEATTARLTAPSGKTTSDFDTGRRWDDENGTDATDITADNYTEFEWVLTTQSPAVTNDYFEFRVYAGSSALDTYTLTPKWTIGTGTVNPEAWITKQPERINERPQVVGY